MEDVSWNQKLGNARLAANFPLHFTVPNLLILNPPVLLEDGMEPKTLGSVTSEKGVGKEARQRTSGRREREKGQISWHRSDRAVPMKTYRGRHLSARDALD